LQQLHSWKKTLRLLTREMLLHLHREKHSTARKGLELQASS
jgi:hypothetical protein